MWNLSGFSDEISPEFEEQCSLVSSLGLKYLEFRSADPDRSRRGRRPHAGRGRRDCGGTRGKDVHFPHRGNNRDQCRRSRRLHAEPRPREVAIEALAAGKPVSLV
jgi:hypothetical protein